MVRSTYNCNSLSILKRWFDLYQLSLSLIFENFLKLLFFRREREKSLYRSMSVSIWKRYFNFWFSYRREITLWISMKMIFPRSDIARIVCRRIRTHFAKLSIDQKRFLSLSLSLCSYWSFTPSYYFNGGSMGLVNCILEKSNNSWISMEDILPRGWNFKSFFQSIFHRLLYIVSYIHTWWESAIEFLVYPTLLKHPLL